MRLRPTGLNIDAMELVDSFDAGVGEGGIVSDYDGLLTEVLMVGVILAVYLVGVATDGDGRKI